MVLALEHRLRALDLDVRIHFVKRQHQSTPQRALRNAVKTLFVSVLLQLFSDDSPAILVIWALDRSVRAHAYMLLRVASPDYLIALCIRTINAQLKHQSPNRNVGHQLTENALVAERALAGTLDAPLTEQVVTAWGLYGVFKDV